jgi:hypothetical protein
MVLYASYVCLPHSRFVENHPIDLEVTDPSFLRWFCHNYPIDSGYCDCLQTPLELGYRENTVTFRHLAWYMQHYQQQEHS